MINLAKKIKKEVLEKTGLTVSIGIAYNKYIAKIASGLNKPDGLCYVENGQEENFMLNLPLSKLWGAGTKTQEKLKSFGFYTTKQIHNAPISTLVTLFGNCTGTFLYKAVRGQEVETFSSETKSHSISAEETYNYDLQDIFTIETNSPSWIYLIDNESIGSPRNPYEKPFPFVIESKYEWCSITQINDHTYHLNVLETGNKDLVIGFATVNPDDLSHSLLVIESI